MIKSQMRVFGEDFKLIETNHNVKIYQNTHTRNVKLKEICITYNDDDILEHILYYYLIEHNDIEDKEVFLGSAFIPWEMYAKNTYLDDEGLDISLFIRFC